MRIFDSYVREYLYSLHGKNIAYKDGMLNTVEHIKSGFIGHLKVNRTNSKVQNILGVSSSTVSEGYELVSSKDSVHEDFDTVKKMIETILHNDVVIASYKDFCDILKSAFAFNAYMVFKDDVKAAKLLGCSVNTASKWISLYWGRFKGKQTPNKVTVHSGEFGKDTLTKLVDLVTKKRINQLYMQHNEVSFNYNFSAKKFVASQEKELLEFIDSLNQFKFVINSIKDIKNIKPKAVIKLPNGNDLIVIPDGELASEGHITIATIRSFTNHFSYGMYYGLSLLQGATVVQDID